MYKKIDIQREINRLEQLNVVAWSGERRKFITVTVENNLGEKKNRKYYFTNHKEYSYFNKAIRRLVY